MDMRSWLQKWLGIQDLQQKVIELDNRIEQIESHITSMLQHFGGYRSRTDSELGLMQSQIETMLETVTNIMDTLENQTDIQRSTRLRYRLKYNLTKIINTRAARVD